MLVIFPSLSIFLVLPTLFNNFEFSFLHVFTFDLQEKRVLRCGLIRGTSVVQDVPNSCWIQFWGVPCTHKYMNCRISSSVRLLLLKNVPFLILYLCSCFLGPDSFLQYHRWLSDKCLSEISVMG